MKISISAFILFYFISMSSYAGFGGKDFPELSDILSAKADEILVKHGVCENVNPDCHKKGMTFRSGNNASGVINVYKYKSIPKEAVIEIISACANAYYENGRKKSIEVNFYSETSEEQSRVFSRIKPSIHVAFKGE